MYALADNRPGYSQDYYQTIINYFPRQRAEAMYRRAGFLKDQAFSDQLFVMPGRSGSPGGDAALKDPVLEEGKDPLKEARELLLELQSSFPSHDEAGRASYLLARIALKEGDLEEAVNHGSEYLDTREGFSLQGHALLLHTYLEKENHNEAANLYEKSLEHEKRDPVDSHLGILYSDRLVSLGKYQKAATVLESELKFLQNWHEEYKEERAHLTDTDPYQADLNVYRYKATVKARLEGLEQLLAQNQGDGDSDDEITGSTLKGQLNLDHGALDQDTKQEILQELEVYLIRPYHQVRSFEMIDKAPKTLVDEQGNFQFDNLPPGRYGVAIQGKSQELSDFYLQELVPPFVELGLAEHDQSSQDDQNGQREEREYQIKLTEPIDLKEPEISNGKFNLEWEEVSEAAYYNFGFGEVFRNEKDEITTIRSRNMMRGLEDNSLSVALEELQQQAPGFSSFRGHITPGSVLGLPYAGGEFMPIVSAYDEDGNLLSNSTAYRNYAGEDSLALYSVSDEEIEMHQGLQETRDMMFNREHIDAIHSLENSYEKYREDLKEDEEIHYLLSLARVYHHGTNPFGRNKDLDLSLEYQEQLENMLDDQDIYDRLLSRVQFFQGMTLLQKREYQQVIELIEEDFSDSIEEFKDEKIERFIMTDAGELLAHSYLLEGNPHDSWEAYQHVMELANRPRQYKEEILLINLVLLEDFDTIHKLFNRDTNLRDEYLYALEDMESSPPSEDQEFYEEYFKPTLTKLIEGQEVDSSERRDAEELIREISYEYPDRQGELYFLTRLYYDMR
ncbi:hypothetical protein Nther_2333 [Natranaerobius thermophilus JW/NM-WN-LF]|uniref:Uncharacterized protein n=2 Tax=Natranaerobius TaxID=375928 RepID=B2A8L4_NATTJ|nr:hypothetical protein Nther_2333 [Natranaerobius thermophilus JW/NM-WN-LF]